MISFFAIRDFIWIITLTGKLKFEENSRSEDIFCNLKFNVFNNPNTVSVIEITPQRCLTFLLVPRRLKLMSETSVKHLFQV